MGNCYCNIAAEFPELGGLGIISASLRTSMDIILTSGGVVIKGPAYGDLSITAYAPLSSNNYLECPGNAGISYGWTRRVNCDIETGMLVIVLVPNGIARSHKEGDVANTISMTEIANYETFSASAASGPHTPYLKTEHYDGYNFQYTGSPIPVTLADGQRRKRISFLENILPGGSKLYLNNFNWTYTPPNTPIVSYSFMFLYDI